MRRALLGLIIVLGMALTVLEASQTPAPREPGTASATGAGERLYREGVGVAGGSVSARVQGDLVVRSTNMPCVNCHKRSGWGTTEGPVTTPALVGHVLFNPVTLGNEQMGLRTTGPGTRPAYDPVSLARAIRDGVSPAGRQLSPTMPRYALGEPDAAALTAYLQALGSSSPPGVTSTTVHLATVTTPGTSARRRDAMLAVLRAFVELKNSGSRNEARRRDKGPWDMKSHYEVYRQWDLHEWSLTGSPAGWRTQLESLYASQPVFAIVSGIGDEAWTPVHEFCEAEQIPCVLPQTPSPPVRANARDFFSIYYSRGLALEAATLAPFLASNRGAGAGARVRQVRRCGAAGDEAARLLSDRIDAGAEATSSCSDRGGPLGVEAWRDILASRPSTVVAWLGADDLAGLDQLASTPGSLDGVERVVLSATLLGDGLERIGGALRARAYLVDPFVAPDELSQHAMRSLIWLNSRGLAKTEPEVAVNTFFAVSQVADALATPRTIESREYLVEQLEHMVGRSPLRSAYPGISLGPGRRFASLGCAVLKVPSEPNGAFTKVVPWTVPDVR